MDKNVYITKLSSFLPNEPVENDEMEDSLGYIGGHSSRIKRIILSQNQIKQRYYAIKGGNYTHTNAELMANAIAGLFDDGFAAKDIQLYSSASNTPLSVGYYTNAPDDKILMTAKDNSGSLYSAGWDLIPSTYKGYFSIQSESYLGQSDPNNSWSVFYHVLEAKANNKLGYAQRVNYRAQQEFLITPTASFTLQNVTFDLENATISNGAVISKVTSLTNVHEYTTNENLTINFNAEETSNFYETAGTLKVNISSPSSIKFPRPRPIAGKAVLMGDESKDAIYSSATQKLSAPVEYSTSIEMKPRCLLQLTTKFKTFILNVPYVAVAKYGDREIKVRGTWRGYSVADPELNKPINEPHYFDLETGEELNYSLSFDPERKIYVTK